MPNKRKGFASMNPTRQREIASQGGKAAHASGHAHIFTSEEARIAGKKGGEASGKSRKQQKNSSQNLENIDIEETLVLDDLII